MSKLEKRRIETIFADLAKSLPPGFSLRIDFGVDHSGERAVWIWVEVPPETVEQQDFEVTDRIRKLIRDRVLAEDVEPWVYVQFTEPDQAPKGAALVGSVG